MILLKLTDTKKLNYDAVTTAFTNHFVPRTNVIYERAKLTAASKRLTKPSMRSVRICTRWSPNIGKERCRRARSRAADLSVPVPESLTADLGELGDV